MKNTRAIVMMLIAVVAGLAAVLFASRWVGDQTRLATKKVVVAAANLELGTTLTPEMLTLADWPRGSVPEGAFDKPDDLVKDPKTGNSRIVKAVILKGEPVLESKLTPPDVERGGLQAVIPSGKRAMTVRVNDVVGVAGFVLPGTQVDIVVNTQDLGNKGGTISKIVLERVKVLATAQETNPDKRKPNVVSAVTLEVTPQEAELLDLARSEGSLSLMLRNETDAEPVLTSGAKKKDLLKFEPEPPQLVAAAPAAQPQPVVVKKMVAPRKVVRKAAPREQVEVIRGVEESARDFPAE